MPGKSFVLTKTFHAYFEMQKLYERKPPITEAELLNDRAVPVFDEQDVELCRALTDRDWQGRLRGALNATQRVELPVAAIVKSPASLAGSASPTG